jgi:hypothetical protein
MLNNDNGKLTASFNESKYSRGVLLESVSGAPKDTVIPRVFAEELVVPECGDSELVPFYMGNGPVPQEEKAQWKSLQKVWLHCATSVSTNHDASRGCDMLQGNTGLFILAEEVIPVPGVENYGWIFALVSDVTKSHRCWAKINPARVESNGNRKRDAEIVRISEMERFTAVGIIASLECKKSKQERSISRIVRASAAN